MADETPDASATPAPSAGSESVPLDQAPLREYVERRGKGETPAAPAPAKPADSTEEPSDDTGDDLPLPDEKKPPVPGAPKKSRFEERLGTLTRQRHDAERALQAERERVLQLQQELQQFRQPKQEQPQPPQLQADGQPPNLDQYLAAGKSYEDWLTALVDFRSGRAVEAERQRIMQDYQAREFQQQMAGFGERTEAAKAKYADYEDVVINNDRVQLSPVMQDIARRSPNGADIMHWLGTHEAEANQIGQMTANYPPASYPLVEAHLLLLSGTTANGNAGAKKAAPISQAPAPITPVGGGTTTQPLPLDQLPLGEYIRRREQQKKKVG